MLSRIPVVSRIPVNHVTNLDHENIPALRTLLASSLGLVALEASSSTVRLVHFTLKEHLLSDSTLFHSPHSTIAEACLTYLNYQCVRDLSPTLRFPPATISLLKYASLYWGEHTRKGMTENVKILALRQLDKFDEHVSAQLILLDYEKQWGVSEPHFNRWKRPTGFTGLHGIAFLGIVEIFAAVLDMKKWDVNARDNVSFTPLMWAAFRGHEEVVKMFLQRRDVNPNLQDREWNQTPLMWAAEKGHEGVVKVFLEQAGVSPNQTSPVSYQKALWLAAKYGHEGIVTMILERRDVNPNQVPIRHSCTPLSVAAYNANEGVVKIFLEREDVNPNPADAIDGRTPLSHATYWGHEGIVKMLLDRNDIRIDIRDFKYKTPLELALSRGHGRIAKMISEQAGAMSEIADPGNQESLPASPEGGEESMTEMQLSNHPDTNTADPSEDLHPHQRTPTRRMGIRLRGLFSRFR